MAFSGSRSTAPASKVPENIREYFRAPGYGYSEYINLIRANEGLSVLLNNDSFPTAETYFMLPGDIPTKTGIMVRIYWKLWKYIVEIIRNRGLNTPSLDDIQCRIRKMPVGRVSKPTHHFTLMLCLPRVHICLNRHSENNLLNIQRQGIDIMR